MLKRCFCHRWFWTIYQASTNAFINTGDGVGMALRAGLPVEDIEFWQFHPTGLMAQAF